MRVLGIDPGPTKSAYALLEHAGGRARWLDAALVDSGAVEARRVLTETNATLVVVERPRFMGLANIAGSLIDTAWPGGGWAWLAESQGRRLIELRLGDWRKALCGRTGGGQTAGDAHVKLALAQVVSDIPSRTNNHIRDAAGVAYIGGQRMHAAGSTEGATVRAAAFAEKLRTGHAQAKAAASALRATRGAPRP